MAALESFPPVIAPGARILILGSMPGEGSLKARQYYAHPQNQFWRILEKLGKTDAAASYETRKKSLKNNQIAVWDVLQYCEREGSLDSAICNETPNDFNWFLDKYPSIRHVFFNGGKAESAFKKLVAPSLKVEHIGFTRLPSTSPAHASRNFAQKCEAWSAILKFV